MPTAGVVLIKEMVKECLGARGTHQLRVLCSVLLFSSGPGALGVAVPMLTGTVWSRVFCREQHHFWASILSPFMAVYSSVSAVLLSMLRALWGAGKAVGWLWQERFVPTALCPSAGHLPL